MNYLNTHWLELINANLANEVGVDLDAVLRLSRINKLADRFKGREPTLRRENVQRWHMRGLTTQAQRSRLGRDSAWLVDRFFPGAMLEIWNPKHCRLCDACWLIVTELIKNSRLHIYTEPCKSPCQREKLPRWIVSVVNLTRLKVATNAIIRLEPCLRDNPLVKTAKPLLAVAVGIAHPVKMHAVATIK